MWRFALLLSAHDACFSALYPNMTSLLSIYYCLLVLFSGVLFPFQFGDLSCPSTWVDSEDTWLSKSRSSCLSFIAKYRSSSLSKRGWLVLTYGVSSSHNNMSSTWFSSGFWLWFLTNGGSLSSSIFILLTKYDFDRNWAQKLLSGAFMISFCILIVTSLPPSHSKFDDKLSFYWLFWPNDDWLDWSISQSSPLLSKKLVGGLRIRLSESSDFLIPWLWCSRP